MVWTGAAGARDGGLCTWRTDLQGAGVLSLPPDPFRSAWVIGTAQFPHAQIKAFVKNNRLWTNWCTLISSNPQTSSQAKTTVFGELRCGNFRGARWLWYFYSSSTDLAFNKARITDITNLLVFSVIMPSIWIGFSYLKEIHMEILEPWLSSQCSH